jgi:acyl carrier protein
MTGPEPVSVAGLRQILAEVTGRPDLAGLPGETALFAEAGLDSLGGALLLRQVRRRYGVDVPAQDLNLDCMQTLDTLVAFIAERQGDPAA